MTPALIAAIDEVLRTAARAEILPRFRNLGASAIRTKSGPLDLVTDADEAAERLIAARLRDLFPGALIVGEEGSDPASIAAIGDAPVAITIDPVDGTSNFAAGVPAFGVMVGVIERGETVGGVIHDPMGDDSVCAIRGGGAWLARRPGERTRPLRVARPAPIREMTGAISWRYLPAVMRARACTGMQSMAATFDFRCAATHYRMCADGHCHMLLFNRLMPWDHAPGALIVTEAGGVALQFDGTPYTPRRTDGGLICAPDAHSWEAARAALLEGPP